MYGNPPVGQIIGDVNNWKTTFGRESGEKHVVPFLQKPLSKTAISLETFPTYVNVVFW